MKTTLPLRVLNNKLITSRNDIDVFATDGTSSTKISQYPLKTWHYSYAAGWGTSPGVYAPKTGRP